jgi:hypothetical protein
MTGTGIGRPGSERAEPLEDRAVARTVARHALQARLDQAGKFRWQAGQVRRLGGEPDEDVHHRLTLIGRVAGRGEHERRAE